MWCVFGACRYFATVNQHECPLSPTGSSPVEETSLHQRSTSNSKDRNWGLFSLRNSDYNARGCDTDVRCLCEAGRFFTVNHRGPLPLREIHSTDDT